MLPFINFGKEEEESYITLSQPIQKLLRAIQFYPNPLNLIKNYVLELSNFHDLEDTNCSSIGLFLEN